MGRTIAGRYSVIIGWCDTTTARCLNATSIDKGGNVRVGLHAYNRCWPSISSSKTYRALSEIALCWLPVPA